MHEPDRHRTRGALRDTSIVAGEGQQPEHDEHHGDSQLERQPEPRRDAGELHLEQDDRSTDEQDRRSVPDPPQRTRACRAQERPKN